VLGGHVSALGARCRPDGRATGARDRAQLLRVEMLGQLGQTIDLPCQHRDAPSLEDRRDGDGARRAAEQRRGGADVGRLLVRQRLMREREHGARLRHPAVAGQRTHEGQRCPQLECPRALLARDL
jgi:hypothetical protein